jgi:hypothetical protein
MCRNEDCYKYSIITGIPISVLGSIFSQKVVSVVIKTFFNVQKAKWKIFYDAKDDESLIAECNKLHLPPSYIVSQLVDCYLETLRSKMISSPGNNSSTSSCEADTKINYPNHPKSLLPEFLNSTFIPKITKAELIREPEIIVNHPILSRFVRTYLTDDIWEGADADNFKSAAGCIYEEYLNDCLNNLGFLFLF